MRILLYCALNPKEPRIHDRTLRSILTLEWDEPIEIIFGRHDCLPSRQHHYDNLLEKHNRARQIALDGNYEALFFVEADMIIPPNALKRMTEINGDVVYGLYCSRRGKHRWLAFSDIGKVAGKSITNNRAYCLDNWGRAIETKGVGMGCTLIRRNVLETFPFSRNGACADDWYFALECQRRGFRQYHDLGVVCGHILDQGGKTIWPTTDTYRMYRYEPA